LYFTDYFFILVSRLNDFSEKKIHEIF